MKTKTRIPTYYLIGSQDWKDQLNMLLDDGVTCGDCAHSKRCKSIFGGDDSNTECQFYPNTFLKPTTQVKDNE